MKRLRLAPVAIAALLLLIFWIASNTYWTEITVPMPPRGEAVTNPFYAAQRFVEALGGRATWDRTLTVPSSDSVIVLSGWNWSLSRGRREAIEQWVESGGRLVVDSSLVGGEAVFERWSSIHHDTRRPEAGQPPAGVNPGVPCRQYEEVRDGGRGAETEAIRYWICDVAPSSALTSAATPQWAMRDASGTQAMRVPVGRGSVTVINANPFRRRDLFEGDHAWLLVAATQFRRGDAVHFLSEDDHPSLVALVWRHGAPVVGLSLALVGLVLWRGGVRFGPLSPPTPTARRSLAEQIRGTAEFALRYGGGEALHLACVRALDEAAGRRVTGYARLSADERAAALARLTGFNQNALAAAMEHRDLRAGQELRRRIGLLEGARRLLLDQKRTAHGRD